MMFKPIQWSVQLLPARTFVIVEVAGLKSEDHVDHDMTQRSYVSSVEPQLQDRQCVIEDNAIP